MEYLPLRDNNNKRLVCVGGNNGRLLQRYDFVCQNHFEEDEVYKGRNIGGELYPYSVWRLKKGTVPSLNLPTRNIEFQYFLMKFGL